MCGIAGTVNLAFNADQALVSMSHRGPDAQTTAT